MCAHVRSFLRGSGSRRRSKFWTKITAELELQRPLLLPAGSTRVLRLQHGFVAAGDLTVTVTADNAVTAVHAEVTDQITVQAPVLPEGQWGRDSTPGN